MSVRYPVPLSQRYRPTQQLPALWGTPLPFTPPPAEVDPIIVMAPLAPPLGPRL